MWTTITASVARPRTNKAFTDFTKQDEENHYYIDGTVLDRGFIPVWKIDTEITDIIVLRIREPG